MVLVRTCSIMLGAGESDSRGASSSCWSRGLLQSCTRKSALDRASALTQFSAA